MYRAPSALMKAAKIAPVPIQPAERPGRNGFPRAIISDPPSGNASTSQP